ncbi:GNAT family N-acetyltransferase [Halovivax limisalsi]|uniref:GNAT family N-acetyltransferase n=1 Tax=Halovivax limisalsi TaxID=1453760 RepID=UPI001FFC49F7|nr:GNAT family protein [Halovivax limisalsi]
MPGSRVERGETVSLRTVEPEDAPFLQRAYAEPGLREPLGRPIRSRSRVAAEIESLAEDDDRVHLLVCLEDDDPTPGPVDPGLVTPIGVVLARRVRVRPNLAVWLAPAHQGSGYAREALTLAIETIFRTHDVPSIGAGVYEWNEASRALLEAVGFTLEGRQRRVKFHDGAYHDNLKYGLLRTEWERLQDG